MLIKSSEVHLLSDARPLERVRLPPLQLEPHPPQHIHGELVLLLHWVPVDNIVNYKTRLHVSVYLCPFSLTAP